MKKELSLFLTIILAWSIIAAAAEPGHIPADEQLFLKEQDGLWGYADRTDTFIIPPQWETAEEFRNHTAFVSHYDYLNEGPIKQTHYMDGLINKTGQYVIEPRYSIDCFQYIYRLAEEINGSIFFGYYDIDSDTCVLPQYDGVCDDFPYYLHRPKSELISVELNGKWGFINRETGKMMIEPQYDDVLSTFCNGYALVAVFDEETNDYAELLIDQNNNIMNFEENIIPVSGVSSNSHIIIEKYSDDDGSSLFGLIDTQGTIIITPQYDYMEWLSDDLLQVYTMDGDLLYLNENGDVIEYAEQRPSPVF